METNSQPTAALTETIPTETYREHALRMLREYCESVNFGLDDEDE